MKTFILRNYCDINLARLSHGFTVIVQHWRQRALINHVYHFKANMNHHLQIILHILLLLTNLPLCTAIINLLRFTTMIKCCQSGVHSVLTATLTRMVDTHMNTLPRSAQGYAS